MIKTVFAVRYTEDGPYIDSCMSVEWPEYLTNETIQTLAEIRGEPPVAILQQAVTPEVMEFLEAYPMMEMRSRMNNLSGPHVVTTEEKPSDAFLLAYLKQKKRKTTKEK